MRLTIEVPDHPFTMRFPAGTNDWTDDDFFEFCQKNRELRIERAPNGEIIVMSPAGGYSGYQSGEVFRQLSLWALRDGTGIAFDSSTGFRLPNGATRAPDAAWVRSARLHKLKQKEKEKFLPLCPDFLIEAASPSDTLSELQEKMREYLAAGLRLGWLILPATKEAEIYRPDAVEHLSAPDSLSGDPVLPGFVLQLASIWNPPF